MPRRRGGPGSPDFCRRYVYVTEIDRLWDRHTRKFITIRAAGRRHAHEARDQDVERLLLCGPNPVDKVDGLTFCPRQEEFVEEDGGIKLNRWVRPTLEPRPGCAGLFLQHVARLVDGDEIAINFVLDWAAHLVQRPDVKIQSALLLIGLQGTGKNVFAAILRDVLGRANTTSITASDFRSEFNGWVAGALLTVVDELVSDSSRATAARIKSVITNEWVRVNEKNVPAYECRNRNHLLLLSNEPDAAILDLDDRRFFVWRSAAGPASPGYYSELCRWIEGGGSAHVLHFLQTRDLSGFNPHAAPPRTQSRAEVAGHSRANHEVYLEAALESCEAPFACDLVVGNHVCDYLSATGRTRVTPKNLGRFLRSVGALELGQKRIQGAKPRVWAVRNQDRWQHEEEDAIAAAYRRPGDAAHPRVESAPQPVRRTRQGR